MENFKFTGVKKKISWGSIIAGVITVLSVSLLLSVLGSSIGLFMFNPLVDNPTSGIGTTVGIWTIISLLISLVAGGFVAGKLAGTDGTIHGFLVWATTLIFTIILGVCLMVGTVKVTASILGSVSSVLGNAVSGTSSAVGSGLSSLSDQVQGIWGNLDIDTNLDSGNMQKNIEDALKKSGVKELQPEYLQNQLNEVKTDLQESVKKLATNPTDADNIIDGFTGRLKERAEHFSDKIDIDDLKKAVATNSNMTKAEVDKTVDQYIEIRNKAEKQGQESLKKLENAIDNAKQEWQVIKQKTLEEIAEATNAAAWAGIISFFSLLVGAVICAYAGLYGTKKSQEIK